MKLEKKRLLLTFLVIVFISSLLKINPVSSATETKLSLAPQINYAAPDESFIVNITVSSVQKLYAWQVNMSFDPNVLEFVNVTEGDFLKRQPEGSALSGINAAVPGWALFGWTTIGEYAGEDGSGLLATMEFRVLTKGESALAFENYGAQPQNYTYLLAQTSPVAPPFFYKTQFTVEHGFFTNLFNPPVADFTYSPEIPGINQSTTFNASASTTISPLEITEYFWDFGDETNATVTTPTVNHTYTTGGAFTVSLTIFDNATASQLVNSIYNTTGMPRIWYEIYSTKEVILSFAFAHDVAVTNITISKVEVAPGETVSINITVLNKGANPEDFTVTVYYDTNEIGTKQVEGLNSGEERTLIFSWDTTGVAEGEYQIKAVASGIEGEGYVDDNEFIDGTVTVKTASESFPTTLVIGGAIGAGVIILVLVIFMRRRSTPST